MADLDWSKIAGPLVQIGGTIIGGALAGPAGAKLGPLAGTILADALGVPADPDAINDAIATKPDAGSIVARVEAAHGTAFRSVEEAYLADIQNARATTVEYVKADSGLQWGAVLISALVLFAFIGFTGSLMLGGIKPGTENLLTGIVELFKVLTVSVVSFWVGSSNGSQQKTSQLADLAKAAAGAVAGAAKPRGK